MLVEQLNYASVFNSVATPMMMLDRDLRYIDMNQSYLDILKRPRDELLGKFLFDAFPEKPERRKVVQEAFFATLNGETTYLRRIPFAITGTGGRTRMAYWTASHVPIRNTNGDIVGLVQHTQDVTSEVEAERLKNVVTRELQHRVGNLLALVMTLARRTAEHAETIESFLARFGARIQSLSETHKLLTGNDWDGLELGDLVHKHLQIYINDKSRDVSIDGPAIRLDAGEAQAMAMAIHELATNAAKYGALANGGGRVRVEWSRSSDDDFNFRWIESGVIQSAKPERKGFGSVILLKVLPAQLNGAARREFNGDIYEYELSVKRSRQSACA